MTVLQNVNQRISKIFSRVTHAGEDGLRVTEGVSGLYHHHLSKNGEYQGLCGAAVMNTSIGLQDWKVPYGQHFDKRPTFCKACDQAAQSLKLKHETA